LKVYRSIEGLWVRSLRVGGLQVGGLQVGGLRVGRLWVGGLQVRDMEIWRFGELEFIYSVLCCILILPLRG